jgi:hypothetical protein
MNLSEFLNPISDGAIRNAYLVDHQHLAPELSGIRNEATVVKFDEVAHHTGEGRRLTYSVDLYLESGESVLDKPLLRRLSDDKRCLESPKIRAKIAFRINFYCRPIFCRKGLAGYLTVKEELVFKLWGAREIHVLAMDSGRWVWTRPQFGYKLTESDFEALKQKYRDWQRERGMMPPLKQVQQLHEFPRNFLETGISCLSLFKVL